MTATVEQGQSLKDIAIQYCGDAAALFSLALLNDISMTEDVAAGTQLQLPPVVNPDVVKYFEQVKHFTNHIPATKLDEAESEAALEGIGYWTIGIDFIVS